MPIPVRIKMFVLKCVHELGQMSFPDFGNDIIFLHFKHPRYHVILDEQINETSSFHNEKYTFPLINPATMPKQNKNECR